MHINKNNTVRGYIKTPSQKQLKDSKNKEKITEFVKPVLTRRLSLSELPKLLGKERAIKEKTGHMWICKDRMLDKYGGFIYSYEFDKTYLAGSLYKKKIAEIYPAIELNLRTTIDMIGGADSYIHFWEDCLLQDFLNDGFVFIDSSRYVNQSLILEKKEIEGLDWDKHFKAFVNEFQNFRATYTPLAELYNNSKEKGSVGKIFVEQLLVPFLETFLPKAVEGLEETLLIKVLEYVRKNYGDQWIRDDKVARSSWERSSKERQQTRLFFNSLGYSCKKEGTITTVFFPDREALVARLKIMHERNSDFPEISIASSEGIATDIEYVKSFFQYDGLLSSSKQQVHDHGAHLIFLLNQLSEPKIARSYKEQKNFFVQEFKKCYGKFKLANSRAASSDDHTAKKACEIYAAILGLSVDIFTSNHFYEDSKSWSKIEDSDGINESLKGLIPTQEGNNLEFFRRRLNCSQPPLSSSYLSKEEVIAKLEWACNLIEGS